MIVRELLARLGMDVDKSSFARAEDSLGRLHLALGGLKDIGLAVKGALDKMLGATAETARETQRMAQITGLTTDQVQELGYAAGQSGLSTEELQHGLVHLARTAQEAAGGSGEAAAVFYKLGLSATGANGKLKPMGELLTSVSAKFAAMPDGPAKAALSMQLFSRGGAAMIQFLDKGPAGLAKLSAEAHKLGVVMGGSALAVSERYRLAQLRLHAAFDGLRNMISVRLMPAFTKSAENLTRWIELHRKFIALKVKEAFEVISRVLESLVDIGKGVFGFFDRIWRSGSTGKTVLIALGAAVLALTSPFTTLMGVLALVAEDIDLYFSSNGKIDTVTGRLIKLGKSLWEGFKTNPFGLLIEYATKFFDWFVTEAAKLPAKIADAMTASSKGNPTFLDFLGSLIPNDTPGGREAMIDAMYAPKRDAFVTLPESSRNPSAANNLVQSFAPTININAPSGDPLAISIAAKNAMSEFWDSRMNEALKIAPR